MASHTIPTSRSTSSLGKGGKATTGMQDLNAVFHQASAFQDLLRFEHDSEDVDPAVAIVQEYARAIRLQFIRTRWSRLGLADWHSEVQIILSARSSMYMGLNIWEPLDDFLDTYIFEMEIQPQSELDARGRKGVKRGLLKQLQETTVRELDNCHKILCDLLEDQLSNWRTLEAKLLTFKKKVELDCEERGSLSLTPTLNEVARLPFSTTFTTPSNVSSISSYTPTLSENLYIVPLEPTSCYTPPPLSDSSSSWTADGIACYTPPPKNYQLVCQPYIC
ncbi:hypothetical protein BDU57DRAFT_298847 [Ampelomyces quisqualis]|uniref:Uncharacterized protein n=1 Tax=Ampelomyces quisqualis TaxID=50730 RepID=A0A6A5QGW9_AMPQU|nr:hypothetical protein BDU57DRAFT_298847 [Ampelomyces quisqualis]